MKPWQIEQRTVLKALDIVQGCRLRRPLPWRKGREKLERTEARLYDRLFGLEGAPAAAAKAA